MSLSNEEFTREKYINELKNLLIEKDVQNNTDNEILDEGYFEWEIEDFNNFIDNADDVESPEFSLCGHEWNISVYSYFGSFILYLQNKDIKSEKEIFCARLAFTIRNYMDFSKYKALLSSLYCFTNTNFDYYSGYKYEIYENEYSEFVKPLIEEEKIVIGVYLQVFKDSKIENYINQIKNSIIYDDYYDIQKENYYEWEIENFKKIKNTSDLSPNFNIGGHEWKLCLYPNDSGVVKFELNNFSSYKLKNNDYFYIHYGIIVRNGYDLTCLKSTVSKKLVMISKKKDKITIDDFLRTDDLYKINEDSNRALLEDNKVVIGVYIRVYSKERDVNNQLIGILKSLIPKVDDGFKIKDENYFEWRIDSWNSLKDGWEYSPEFNIGNYYWYIRLCPDYNEYAHLKLEIRYSLNAKKGEEEIVYAHCVLVMHRIDDVLCYKAKTTSIMKKFDYNNWSIDFLKFIKKEDLYTSNEGSDKSLMKNNQIVISAYIRVYDKC